MAIKKPIYLDHAATTPVDPLVFAAMQPYFTDNFYNPSATYTAARAVKRDIEVARASIAHHLGARPNEITFTAGGTEANNLFIHGVMQKFPGANCVVSAVEHDSVLKPAGQYDVRIAPVLPDGTVDLKALEKLIDDKTVLVSVMYANNEIGTIQPIKQIAQIVAKKRTQRSNHPLYLHTDACQASAYLDLHVSRLGVDAMTINASKIYGPKQVGALFVKAGVKLQPQIVGGGQERGLRSGTEQVAGVIGLAAALELVQSRRHEEVKHLKQLQQLFISELTAAIPAAMVNGSMKHRLPGNVHLTIPGQDNERLMILLDNQGVLCAVGSACSASNEEPSHVLKAIGLSDIDAQASLRFTMGHTTTEADIRFTVNALREALNP